MVPILPALVSTGAVPVRLSEGGAAPGGRQSATTKIPKAKRRQTITKACTPCRERKSKCDGDHPCERCLKKGTECIYPLAASLGPNQLKIEHNLLLKRVGQHEELYSMLRDGNIEQIDRIVKATRDCEGINEAMGQLRNGIGDAYASSMLPLEMFTQFGAAELAAPPPHSSIHTQVFQADQLGGLNDTQSSWGPEELGSKPWANARPDRTSMSSGFAPWNPYGQFPGWNTGHSMTNGQWDFHPSGASEGLKEYHDNGMHRCDSVAGTMDAGQNLCSAPSISSLSPPGGLGQMEMLTYPPRYIAQPHLGRPTVMQRATPPVFPDDHEFDMTGNHNVPYESTRQRSNTLDQPQSAWRGCSGACASYGYDLQQPPKDTGPMRTMHDQHS